MNNQINIYNSTWCVAQRVTQMRLGGYVPCVLVFLGEEFTGLEGYVKVPKAGHCGTLCEG